MSKEEKIYSIIISAVLAVIAALSFIESVTVKILHGWGMSLNRKITEVYTGYFPVFICILILLQLILLWVIRKRFILITCALLDLLATIGPFVMLLYAATIERAILEEREKHIYDVYYGYIEVKFKWPVYVILVLGIVVFFLYLVLRNHRKESLTPVVGQFKGKSIACMACGIASTALSWLCGCGLIPAIVSLVLGSQCKKESVQNTFTKVGKATSIIGLVMSIIILGSIMTHSSFVTGFYEAYSDCFSNSVNYIEGWGIK